MAVKLPFFCTSHTVQGTASVVINDGTTDRTVTVAEGQYWIDPLLSGVTPASDHNDLWVQLLYQFNVAIAGSSMAFTYTADEVGFYYPAWSRAVGTKSMQFKGSAANTTAAGRKILQRLGINQVANDPAGGAAGSGSPDNDILVGTWYQGRGEVADIDEQMNGVGHTMRSWDGTAYSFNNGDPLHRRTVSLALITAAYARLRAWTKTHDTSFERHIATPLMAGESLRYYADLSVAKTYLTAALTATASTASVPSNSIANNDWLSINGEWVKVTSGGGTTTLTLMRPRPVAHSKYDPISKDFVGTYVLDNSNSDVSMEDFFPKRRNVESDYWNIAMTLLRAVP